MTQPPLKFNPFTGAAFVCAATPPFTGAPPENYRSKLHTNLVWRFNPWTGIPRNGVDIANDPQGRAIWEPTWGPMPVAQPTMRMDKINAAEADAAVRETDPTGRDAHAPGAKLDAGKTLPWLCIAGFSHALAAVADVTTKGARKYTPNGWASVPEGEARYMEAFARHMLAQARGERVDADTQCLHKAQMIWNLLASLELELRRDAGWEGHK